MIIRFRKDLQIVEKGTRSWRKSSRTFPSALAVITLFKAHNNFNMLIDSKDPRFLKGMVVDDAVRGARLNVLPDGRKLDKAYSLFAEHLVVHDQSGHWDVMYKNPNSWAYCYTLDKKEKARKTKFNKVRAFDKKYSLLLKNVLKGLKKNEALAVTLWTLLQTKMRVGNEIYYKNHGHKGLTTLMKKDISIRGHNVTFSYLAKDGVPLTISQEFNALYIQRLRNLLKPLKNKEFVFANSRGHPLSDMQIKAAIKQYCGTAFYPHIIRSHYATTCARDFLKSYRNASKAEVQKEILSIAHSLGHSKFSKKEKMWKDSYAVTLNHYIEPSLVQRIKKLL